MNELTLKLKELQPYLLDIKSLFGLGIIIFALYMGVTKLPEQWKTYSDTLVVNGKLEQNKNNLSLQETKLRNISKELDKITTHIVQVEPGNSPELTVIKVTEAVITLAESAHNTYVGLQPGQPVTLDVEKSVTLPITIPGTPTPPPTNTPAPIPATPPAEGAPAAPAASPPSTAPPVPGGAPPTSAQAPLSAYKYTLKVTGSYLNLATFIYQLCKLPDFVLINTIALEPNATAGNTANKLPSPDKISKDNPLPSATNDITLTLDFTVPWK